MNNLNFVEGRYDSLGGKYHYSQQEIEFFAMAIGVNADMVEIQRDGQLGLKIVDKQDKTQHPAFPQVPAIT